MDDVNIYIAVYVHIKPVNGVTDLKAGGTRTCSTQVLSAYKAVTSRMGLILIIYCVFLGGFTTRELFGKLNAASQCNLLLAHVLTSLFCELGTVEPLYSRHDWEPTFCLS